VLIPEWVDPFEPVRAECRISTISRVVRHLMGSGVTSSIVDNPVIHVTVDRFTAHGLFV